MEVTGLCSQVAEWPQHGALCAVIFTSGEAPLFLGCLLWRTEALGLVLTMRGGSSLCLPTWPTSVLGAALGSGGPISHQGQRSLPSGAALYWVSGQATLRILLPCGGVTPQPVSSPLCPRVVGAKG